jgi:hypothetical protein
MRPFYLFIALPLISSVVLGVTEGKNARDAATQSLGTLRTIVTKDNYRAMGFASVDEVSRMELGSPFSMFYVRLDQLRGFKSLTNPDTLLVDSGRLLYPVSSGGAVRSSITMAMVNEQWRATGFGQASFVQRLVAARKDAGDVVVQIPSLSLTFLGRRVQGQLMLEPILDDARLGLRAGAALPAADVFTRLVPEANRYNGLPR